MTHQQIIKELRNLEVKKENQKAKMQIIEALKELTNPNRPKSNRVESRTDPILKAMQQAKNS